MTRRLLTVVIYSLSNLRILLDQLPHINYAEIFISLQMKMSERSQPSISGLENLPLSINRYPYKGPDDFIDILFDEQDLQNEVFLMTGVTEREFKRDFYHSSERIFYSPPKEYCYETQLLLVETGAALELHNAILRLNSLILSAICPMGLEDNLIPTRRSGLNLYRSYKRPRDSIESMDWDLPKCLRQEDYRSCVFEASSSATMLHRDAMRWLSATDANIVITILTNKERPEITIRRWGSEDGNVVVKQETILRKGRATRAHEPIIQVLNAPFIIPLEPLLRRPPRPNSNEGDVKLGKDDLMKVAGRVWRIQGF